LDETFIPMLDLIKLALIFYLESFFYTLIYGAMCQVCDVCKIRAIYII
jgi:hypothetical protein